MKIEKDDKVMLSLTAEEIEEELANVEDLRDMLLDFMRSGQDKKELAKTFETAITAMQMVWIMINGGDLQISDEESMMTDCPWH